MLRYFYAGLTFLIYGLFGNLVWMTRHAFASNLMVLVMLLLAVYLVDFLKSKQEK